MRNLVTPFKVGTLCLLGLSIAAACTGDDVAPAKETAEAGVYDAGTSDAATALDGGGSDAAVSGVKVDEAQFLPAAQLKQWQIALDERGLRATGNAAHEGYIDELHARLSAAGVAQLRFEPVPLTRWSTDQWSLDVVGGASAGPVNVAAYIPYSGQTPPTGITAPLVVYSADAADAGSLAGKIVLFKVPKAPITVGVFKSVSLSIYDPQQTVTSSTPYDRPYLAISALNTLLERLEAAGAAGAIGIIDQSASAAHGSYFPYDRKLRHVPSLFVDRDVGAQLGTLAGAQVKLTLPAKVESVVTRNLIGIIPGASDELTVIHSHTDGTNGIEDNGPNAIVAMAQYLSRVPRAELPRTMMILLTTGHFAGGNGAEQFLAAHRDDGLLARMTVALTVEHLGAQEWLPDDAGVLAPTGRNELAGMFEPNVPALVQASAAALQRANATPGFVMHPLNPSAEGGADTAAWPGEGQYLWAQGRITTANYITGPTYLLNWGVTTSDKVDYDLMRRESISFTQMLLDLSRVPASALK